MKVFVLGAGVIGVATAHCSAEDGHEGTVVERQPAPALETSFGNPGYVCPSYATPWAAPGMRWKALTWLLQSDAPLAVRWAQGWSMPCGSGRIVAHLAADRAADIALEGLTLERYA